MACWGAILAEIVATCYREREVVRQGALHVMLGITATTSCNLDLLYRLRGLAFFTGCHLHIHPCLLASLAHSCNCLHNYSLSFNQCQTNVSTLDPSILATVDSPALSSFLICRPSFLSSVCFTSDGHDVCNTSTNAATVSGFRAGVTVFAVQCRSCTSATANWHY